MSSRWLVYVIESSDGSYYTGITNNLRRRWLQHTSGKGGAKYFRGRQPKAVVFIEWQHNIGQLRQPQGGIEDDGGKKAPVKEECATNTDHLRDDCHHEIAVEVAVELFA